MTRRIICTHFDYFCLLLALQSSKLFTKFCSSSLTLVSVSMPMKAISRRHKWSPWCVSLICSLRNARFRDRQPTSLSNRPQYIAIQISKSSFPIHHSKINLTRCRCCWMMSSFRNSHFSGGGGDPRLAKFWMAILFYCGVLTSRICFFLRIPPAFLDPVFLKKYHRKFQTPIFGSPNFWVGGILSEPPRL